MDEGRETLLLAAAAWGSRARLVYSDSTRGNSTRCNMGNVNWILRKILAVAGLSAHFLSSLLVLTLLFLLHRARNWVRNSSLFISILLRRLHTMIYLYICNFPVKVDLDLYFPILPPCPPHIWHLFYIILLSKECSTLFEFLFNSVSKSILWEECFGLGS